MKQIYPYASRLKKQLRRRRPSTGYHVWQSAVVPEMVAAIHKPVVEIGGPTQDGFYFLDSVEFNSRVLITNISPQPLPFSPQASELAEMVDEIVDATNMPYPDGTIGIFLMAAMSISSDWWVSLSDDEKDKAKQVFDKEFVHALQETKQVAAGVLKPIEVKDAQRIKIYMEISRCLDAGGLLFADGSHEEIEILTNMGFEMVACLTTTDNNSNSYEFVMRKRSG